MTEQTPDLEELAKTDPEFQALLDAMRANPLKAFRQWRTKQAREKSSFTFGPSEKHADGEPSRYELSILRGMQADNLGGKMFAGIDSEHPTKPLAKNLQQRRKKNKLARNSRARNRRK